jgi:hypothetical protein
VIPFFDIDQMAGAEPQDARSALVLQRYRPVWIDPRADVRLRLFGATITFGTDVPLGSMYIKNSAGFMEWTLRAVEGMDIPRAEKEKIYLENAVQLLNLAV